MAQYIFAPDSRPTTIAPSFGGEPEPGNPTVLPLDVLRQFHWTFLIRHPRRSVPSYWRCSVPPRKDITGWEYYDPGEAGYVELVKLLDYLDEQGVVAKGDVTVVDADDVLDDPEGIIKAYCQRTGIEFSPSMLQWNDADDKHAEVLFEKWNGWHDDALKTSCLQKRTHRQVGHSYTATKRYIANRNRNPSPKRRRMRSGLKSMARMLRRLSARLSMRIFLTMNISSSSASRLRRRKTDTAS